ncbi:MAG: efflux RND transporter periplasmic adaptor subunit [Leptotrichiaceae bacterium]|jgi:HlyD family secretion protein|nr:efflux RND transporter periplasmic adaptor subunit [Leptotrichiaceae bacterium]MBP9596698.1 efflux RND transporter periplasmic adaptor subunit [Fusobacteriaceae bacterium]
MKNNKILILIPIIIIAIVSFVNQKNKKNELQVEENLGVPVIIAKVLEENMKDTIFYTGIVNLDKELTVFSQTNGIIENMNLEIGERINKNDIIALIDKEQLNIKKNKMEEKSEINDSKIEKSVLDKKILKEKINLLSINIKEVEKNIEEIESKIKSGSINLSVLKNQYQRDLDLFKNNALPKSKFEISEANYLASIENLEQLNILLDKAKINKEKIINEQKQLNLNVMQIDTSLKQIKAEKAIDYEDIKDINLQLSYTEIRSNVNGIILEKYKEGGELLGVGQAIIKIGDDSRINLLINIPEELANKLNIGLSANIKFNGIENIYTGILTKKYPEINKKTGLLSLEFQVNNEENLLKKGMTGKLELVLEEKNNVLKIPKEAIIEKNGKSYVFVVVNNYAEEREVLLGITDDSNVEVLKGLKMQDKIVIDGNKNLKGNDKVYIWKEGE